jgi:hypothetical protein
MAKHVYAKHSGAGGKYVTKGSGASGKYVVEIDRSGEGGEIKKIPFRKPEAALKLGKFLHKRQTKVRVLNQKGQEIYPCQ